jgi:hypothetical protein
LLSIEERRLTAWRNAPNVVRIISRAWLGWLRLRASPRGGCKFPKATTTQENNKGALVQRNRIWAAEGQGAGRSRINRNRERLVSCKEGTA